MELTYGRLPESDLREICDLNAQQLEFLSNKEIVIFGGTGFVGKWLVSTLLYARREMNLRFDLTLVGRNEAKSCEKLSIERSGEFRFVTWDFIDGPLMNPITADVYFLGSTPSVPETGSLDKFRVKQVSTNSVTSIVEGMQRSRNSRVINLSSGAVFGNLQERALDDQEYGQSLSEYGKIKVEMEKTLDQAALTGSTLLTHARLFTFAGPHISLHDHFAVGNFIKDSISGRSIRVKGSSETMRSYMHPRDLVRSLLCVNEKSDIKYLNIGSEIEISMGALAEKIDLSGAKKGVFFENPDQAKTFYCPKTTKLTNEVNLGSILSLDSIIDRWKRWLSSASNI